jgi:hypothetical protein
MASPPPDGNDASAASRRQEKLVGARGAAEMLGVTPDAVRKLVARGRFPAPDVSLEGRRLWCRTTIEAYARNGRRPPGRPRKSPEATAGEQRLGDGRDRA